MEGTGFEEGACGGYVTPKVLAKFVGSTHRAGAFQGPRGDKKIDEKTEQEITALGDDRPTVGHLRMFLSRLAM